MNRQQKITAIILLLLFVLILAGFYLWKTKVTDEGDGGASGGDETGFERRRPLTPAEERAVMDSLTASPRSDAPEVSNNSYVNHVAPDVVREMVKPVTGIRGKNNTPNESPQVTRQILDSLTATPK